MTLFHGDGVQGVMAWSASGPQSLTKSLAMALAGVSHPKLCKWGGAILALSPDHYAVYSKAGLGRRATSRACCGRR